MSHDQGRRGFLRQSIAIVPVAALTGAGQPQGSKAETGKLPSMTACRSRMFRRSMGHRGWLRMRSRNGEVSYHRAQLNPWTKARVAQSTARLVSPRSA